MKQRPEDCDKKEKWRENGRIEIKSLFIVWDSSYTNSSKIKSGNINISSKDLKSVFYWKVGCLSLLS